MGPWKGSECPGGPGGPGGGAGGPVFPLPNEWKGLGAVDENQRYLNLVEGLEGLGEVLELG